MTSTAPSTALDRIPKRAKALVGVVVLACLALSIYAATQGIPSNDTRFAILLVLAVAAARMKLTLPGFESSMSMNLPFILIGIIDLSLGHAIVIGCLSTFVQSLPRSSQQMKMVQGLFNVCNMCNAIAISFFAANQATHIQNMVEKSPLIVAAAAAFFIADTLPVAGIIATTEGGDVWKLWGRICLLTLPYFVLSAGVATIVVTAGKYVAWAWALVLPLMFAVYLSFRLYFRGVAAGTRRNTAQAAAAGD
ncbi:MAG: hypothetical protein L0Z53_15605 [Acidobacteriales bacterium]|nr:hypothetical protein [Terriglobales bacterium]